MSDDINVRIEPVEIQAKIQQTVINIKMLQQGPKGDGPVWGDVVGDINAQTDLQAEFATKNDKMPFDQAYKAFINNA